MMYQDQDAARAYLEARRWPNGICCPACGETGRITARKGGFYRCNRCKTDFTVRTGTVLQRSHVPLHKWLRAIHVLATSRNVTSIGLAKAIGVTQKTAWLMLRKLRKACGDNAYTYLVNTPQELLDEMVDRVLAYRVIQHRARLILPHSRLRP